MAEADRRHILFVDERCFVERLHQGTVSRGKTLLTYNCQNPLNPLPEGTRSQIQ